MITLVCRGQTCDCLVEDNCSARIHMEHLDGLLHYTQCDANEVRVTNRYMSPHTPQALLYKKYSTDSDVWSYGMVLFEIWSVAKKPFSSVTNMQALRLIQTGFCQAPPPGCPRAVYELMVDCW